MSDENEQLDPNQTSVNYGAVVSSTALDEDTPLLGTSEDPNVGGDATQPLLSSVSHARRAPQYIAALSVTLGAFALGNVLAWSSPAEITLEKQKYTQGEISWIGSSVTLGAMAGVVPVGILMDKLGRKYTMLALVVPFVAGWLFIIFANSVGLFITGRFIVGMSGGAFSLSAPIYTSEISENQIRGMLGSFFQLMVTIGVLFVYVLGSQVNLMWLSVVCGVVPIIFGIIFIFMPETPLYYIRCGREGDARKSLQWFRGPAYDIEPDMNEIKESVARAEREKVSFIQSFSTTAAKRALFIAFGLMLFQQMSGVNAIIFYTSAIFKDAGSKLDASLATIIVGLVQVIATFISSLVVDRLGRRFLLLLSDIVMATCTLALGVFFYMKEHNHDVGSIGWLPLTSLCIFIIVFSLGYGPIPWMMIGELFPLQIKGAASSVVCSSNWLFAFLVTKLFSIAKDDFGSAATYWLFSGMSLIGTIFVFFLVPETKGKSLEQIQRELASSSRVSPEASAVTSQ